MESVERERNRWPRAHRFARLSWVVLLMATSASCFGAGLDARTMTGLGFEAIELRRTAENHLYLSGRANGHRASCLVDTGWSYTTMQPGKASGDGGITLQLGRVTFTNQPARVEAIRFNGKPASFDVVLGLDFLQSQAAVLDCGRHRLHTRRPSAKESKPQELETALRRAGFEEVQLWMQSPPALTVHAQANGQAVQLLLDSGAAWSCLDERQVLRLGLKPQPSTTRITGAGKTGTRTVAVTTLRSFALGEREFSPLTLALFDLADWGFAAPEAPLREVQGILGGELLATLNAVIDCQQRKLWIQSRPRR